MNDIYIAAGARTAIGTFGGALAGFRPAEIATKVIVAALARGGLTPSDVENVVMGTIVPTQPSDLYISRAAAIGAGIPVAVPAMNVNRLCGSGLQAILSAAQAIALGEHAVAVAGGTEIMSRALRVIDGTRTGVKMGDLPVQDFLLGALHDPFGHFHMGVTAENVARRCAVSRTEQDEAAVESHRRAARAIAQGYFREQNLPVEVRSRRGTIVFDTDEHVRPDATIAAMATLKPVFEKDGTVTAGNASGLNDGAAAVVLASGDAVAARGITPMARIAGWGHAGVEPELMGLGPVKAVPVALRRAGVSLDQIDVIESNEAFAAQACAVARQLGLDPARTNPNGSGISLGHPIGATGAILTIKAMYELHRTGGRFGLVTMCIGGGQGIAMVIERA
jgi:acetyl-CoA C-acetyltransferase